MRIDAHQHFWKLDRGDYGWLTEDIKPLYRDFLPEDLKQLLVKPQIDKTIVVQAAPTVEETDFLLKLYSEYEWIAGVVGWLDLGSPEFPEQFRKYQEREGFIGIRPMLQDLEDDRWILQSNVLKNIELLVQEDFPLDILINPRHLHHIYELLQIFPSLRGVIDHIAKPFIRDQVLHPWKEELEKLATFPNVMCKLSGMITEADPTSWKNADLFPYVSHVLHTFGYDRVMFGSDWPVCLLAGSYNHVYTALMENLPGELTEEQQANIFGKNALSFYRLKL